MYKKVFTLILVISLNYSIAQSDKTIIKGEIGQKLERLLTPYLINLRSLTNNEAGLAVGVTKGNDIIYARTFGFADIEKSNEVDFNTVFHIASVSKPFTAAAVVKLIEQGKLNLEDRIIEYIPEFEMKEGDFQNITVKQILTHTSGIPRHVSSGDWDNPVIGNNALEINLVNAKALNLDFPPGTEFNYSNSAFDILGVLISRVSGMPFDEYVIEHILKPAGMINSLYKKPKDLLPPNWAVPYSYGLTNQEWKPYPYTENYFPSSGLQTTLIDMCNWGRLHVQNGNFMGHQVIEEEFFSLLTTPSYETPWGGSIGLSWFLQSYMDRPIIMHQGSDTGFESIVYIYPEDSISIIVLANRDFSRTARIMNATSEFLFENNAKNYTISAKYPFTETYLKSGIAEAIALWETLKMDTSDLYFVEDEDILTTGAVLENGGRWQAAKEILEFYISLDDQSTYAWRLLGNANLNLGDMKVAKSCYEQTLIIDPNYEKGKDALESMKKKNE